MAIRDKALAIMDGFMRKDEQIKIQYASKYAGISNSWKKWQGEMLGLNKIECCEKEENIRSRISKKGKRKSCMEISIWQPVKRSWSQHTQNLNLIRCQGIILMKW